MTEEWPIGRAGTATAEQPGDRAHWRNDRRLATVLADFFLHPAERLTEQERALMTGMLHGLIGSVADDLCVRLPDDLAAACAAEASALADDLTAAGLLQSKSLVAALLQRARMSGIADAAGGGGIKALLHQWSADEDSDIAAAAMALILARSRARDRFGRLTLDLSDLPQREGERLPYVIAAALAARCVGPADSALAEAAADLAARWGDRPHLDQACRRLAEALKVAGRVNQELLVTLVSRGEAPLLTEVLAARAQLQSHDAWDLLTGGGSSLALLLRMAGLPRETAASIIAAGEAVLALGDSAAAIEHFDGISEDQVVEERRRLTRPAVYRLAQEALEARG